MRVHLPEVDGQDYVVDKNIIIEWVTFLDEDLYTGINDKPPSYFGGLSFMRQYYLTGTLP